jgi:hypothetical protein
MQLESQFESQLRSDLIGSVGKRRDEEETRGLWREKCAARNAYSYRRSLQLFQSLGDFRSQVLGGHQGFGAVAGDAHREDERDRRRTLSCPPPRTQFDLRRANLEARL